MNLVMTSIGEFIEVQGSGEEATFRQDQLDRLLALGKLGITRRSSPPRRNPFLGEPLARGNDAMRTVDLHGADVEGCHRPLCRRLQPRRPARAARADLRRPWLRSVRQRRDAPREGAGVSRSQSRRIPVRRARRREPGAHGRDPRFVDCALVRPTPLQSSRLRGVSPEVVLSFLRYEAAPEKTLPFANPITVWSGPSMPF